MDFEFDALKFEYKELVPKYEKDSYFLQSNGNEEEKDRYIKKRILIKARTLLDCHETNHILKGKSFTPLDLIMTHKSCVERCGYIDYYKQIEFFVNA